jgi:RNA polymerase sigma-70 factor, ECF subfamily
MPRNSTIGLIAAARGGDADALGALLEQHRDRFRIIARVKLDSAVRGRIDPSDVIQQTFLAAKRDFHQFIGEASGQFEAWLNTILDHNVSNIIQFHARAQRRSVFRERRLNNQHDRESDSEPLPGNNSSPSQHLARIELREFVVKTLDQLPTAEKEAVRMRYLDDLSLDEIATQLDRSKQAVAGLLKRGLRRLRTEMAIENKESGP